MNSSRMGMSKFLPAQAMKLRRSTLLIEPMGLMSAEEPEAISLIHERHLEAPIYGRKKM